MKSAEELRRASVHRPPSRLPHFQLADQFGRERDELAYESVPVIVVAGNREGAKGVALWTAALRDVIRPASETEVLSVADLGGVPRMLRVWSALPLDIVDRVILATLVQGAEDAPAR